MMGAMAARRRVLVLGTAFRAGPWTCRSLRADGFAVLGAEEGHALDGRSLGMAAPLRCPPASADPAGFAAWVAGICLARDVAAVVSTDEDMTAALAMAAADMGRTVVAGPGAAAYAALCDKAGLHGTADAAGVPHAAWAVVRPGGGAGALPAPPCVVKPRRSGEGAALAAIRADTVGERDAAVARLVAAGHEAVVEGWLPGRQVVVYAVRGAGGAFTSLAARVVDRRPRAAGTPSVMVTGPEPACEEMLRRLLDAVDYRGPANAQFLVDGDVPAVHDVNLRIGAAVAMAMRAGLDVPALGVRAALGGPVPRVRVRDGVVYLDVGSEARAFRLAVRAREPGEMARTAARALRACRGGARLDPPPWEPFHLAGLGLSGARRALRRVRPRRSPR